MDPLIVLLIGMAVVVGGVLWLRLHAFVALIGGALVVGSLCALSRPWAVLVLGAGVVAGPAVRRVMGGAEGLDLIDVLGRTGRTQLAAGVLLAAGLALSA